MMLFLDSETERHNADWPLAYDTNSSKRDREIVGQHRGHYVNNNQNIQMFDKSANL